VQKPIVLITGASGNLGRSVAAVLANDYQPVGLDLRGDEGRFTVLSCDFTSDVAVRKALQAFRKRFGSHVASVVHLAAYFDFSGEDDPRYQSVNVDGTRRLLQALQGFDVDQFVHASTMLVHAPCRPGERIDESQAIDPRWAYPQSKAQAEAVVREARGRIPAVLLRLAGVYDEQSMVPTLAHQMARIYERDLQSYFYSGSTLVGQSMLHRDDMLDAFRRTVDRRATLPPLAEILIGEADAMGYGALQDELGALLHGEQEWTTLRVPKPLAAAGAWAQAKLEPVIPDAVDGGEEPFIKPFMVAMADDHYALDTGRARELLGWEPRHRLIDWLPRLVDGLKKDPLAWYQRNGVPPPAWVSDADDLGRNPQKLRARHEARSKTELGANRWAHFVNLCLATWLLTQPLLIDVQEPWLRRSEMLLGAALLVFATLSLSWRMPWARWVCAGIGALVMAAPFLFSTGECRGLSVRHAGRYADLRPGGVHQARPGPQCAGRTHRPGDTARLELQPIGVDPAPAHHRAGADRPVRVALSGRLPARTHSRGGRPLLRRRPRRPAQRHRRDHHLVGVAGLAGVGRRGGRVHLPAGDRHRLRRIDAALAHDALAGGAVRADDRAAGHHDHLLHHHPAGAAGHLEHDRADRCGGGAGTDPLFAGRVAGHLAVPAPARPGRSELAAHLLRRRHRRGRQDGAHRTDAPALADEFDRPPRAVLKAAVFGGVSLPWNLGLAALLGLLLLFTRPLLGADGTLAHAHHVIGSLVLTVVSIAAAEVARPVRFLNLLLGVALAASALLLQADMPTLLFSLLAGAALAGLSLRRGPILERYGSWSRLLV
jgi:nucleoside-diphosphate-sugar epimerase